MKKRYLLTLMLLPMLAGCIQQTYHPKHEYPGALPPESKVTDMTVNFYYDFSHSEEPYFSMRWYSLTPLGQIPESAVLSDADAKDPLYPTFLGFSETSSCMDESLIWDFTTDSSPNNILNLYGVWVAK